MNEPDSDRGDSRWPEHRVATVTARPDRTMAAVLAVELRHRLDGWQSAVRTSVRLSDREADAVERLHGVSTTATTWIEKCPERCQEMGLWWGGTDLADLAVVLPDVVDLVQRDGSDVALLLKSMQSLRRKGWLVIDSEWRVSPRLPPDPRCSN